MTARIARNAGVMTAGKVLGDGLTFLFFVALSRTYGQEGLGQYSLAMALTGFLMATANGGLYYMSLKELGRRDDSYLPYFGRLLSARLCLVVVAVVMLAGLVLLAPFTGELRRVVLLIGLYQIFYTVLTGTSALFVARGDARLAAILEVLLRAAAAGAGAAIALSGGSLVLALSGLPASTIVLAAVSILLVVRRYGPLPVRMRFVELSAMLREARPYALSQFLFLFTSRMDVLFLGVMLGTAAAGAFNAAYRVVFLLNFTMHLVGVVVLPRASALFIESRDELRGMYHRALRISVLVTVPASLGLVLIAPRLIGAIYGEAFVDSVPVLQIVAFLFVCSGLKYMMEVFLMACDRAHERTAAQWRAALVNVGGNLLLIPIFGIPGAAIATLVSESVLVLLLAVRLRDLLGWPRVGSRILIASVSASCFLVPLSLFSAAPMWIVVPAGLFIYPIALSAFPVMRRDEGRFCLAAVPRGRGRARLSRILVMPRRRAERSPQSTEIKASRAQRTKAVPPARVTRFRGPVARIKRLVGSRTFE